VKRAGTAGHPDSDPERQLSDSDGITVLRGLSETDELLTGTDGSDVLSGGSGDDTLNGNGGDDRLIGRLGSDSISGGEGDDRLNAGSGDDTLNGGAGDDVLWDGDGNDLHFGGLGADRLVGHAGNDTLFGGEGFDRIYGGIGDDELSGNGGTDFVYGGADNDTVAGGSGFDKLTGGDGADVFLIEAGSGRDVIRDFQPGVDRIDVTALGVQLSFEHVVIEQMGPHTWINFRGDEGLTLYNTDASTITASDFVGLSGTTTADLRLIDRGDDDALTGGGGDDYIRGGAGSDALSGGAGNDIVWADEGDNSLLGGDGDDRLRAGAGNDTLDGGDGSDRLRAGDGDDSASGGAGDDLIFGGGGADTIDGGDGADILTGGAGNDRFVASAGGDVIRDFTPGEDVIDVTALNTTFADLTIHAVGPHTAVDLPTGEVILLFNTNPVDLSASDFDFGTATPPADPDNVVGTAGDDNLTAIDRNSISGLEGNDTIDLRANFGEAFGGDGNDDITIGLSPNFNDTASAEAFGGAGDDTIRTLDQESSAEGGDGNDLIIVANRSFVDGGVGDDTLGYSGEGVAIFDASFREFPENAPGGYVIDGQTASARGIENLGGGIVAGIIGTSGTSGDDVIGDDDALQASNLGTSNIFAGAGNDTVHGFAGNDSIRGQFGDDLLFGGDGDDTLLGDAGNDTLDGGAGSNFLTGGAGADVFVISLGATGQVISDFTVGEDLIDFGGPADVFGELTVSDSASGATLNIDGRQIARLEGLTVADLSDSILVVNTAAELFAKASGEHIRATTDIEHVFGGQGNDTLSDSKSIDGHTGFLFGAGGNDHLNAIYDGGALFGGDGNDGVQSGSFFPGMDDGEPTLLFGGNGNDTIQIADATDIAYGGAGDDVIVINPGGHFFGGDGEDRLVFFANAPDVVVDLTAGAYVWEGGVESLGDVEDVSADLNEFGVISIGQFADTDAGDGDNTIGDGIQEAQVQQRILAGAGSDTVFGFDHDDEIFGGAGSDILFGGNDADTLRGDGGLDLLEGGEGDDVLFGGDGGDTLIGGSGDNTLTGGNGRDDFVIATIGNTGTPSDTVVTDFDVERDQINGVLRLTFDGVDSLSGLTFTHLNSGGSVTLQGLSLSDLTAQNAVPTGDGFAAEEGGIMLFRLESNDEIFRGYEAPEATHFGDYLVGGATDDTLLGLGGNDTIFGGEGNDNVNGGGGNDLLFGGLVESGADVDRLFGGAGDDTLNGDGSHNASLFGGAGNDVLRNGTDNGQLFGGDGNDTLFAGANRTEITGGAGNDLFVFDQQFDGSPVILQDFAQGEDLLDFSALNLSFGDLTIESNAFVLDARLVVRFSGNDIDFKEDDFIF
jgi:Ca2+-binding RTX toxin-like protein